MSYLNSQFSILDASIITTSTSDEDRVIDIKSNVMEIQFFEHIGKPYVDGRIVFLDDMGLKSGLSLRGTERIRIVLSDSDNLEEPNIIKYFFFSKITEAKKMNERSEIISIDLVEEHVFVDAIKQFSRSYTSTLEDMIKNIASTDLNKNTEDVNFSGSVQGVRKVIIPYMSPISAIQWIKNRATTKTGSPIYLYSSLYDDNLKISDLDNLLKDDIINEKLPLRFTKSTDGVSDELKPLYEILNFSDIKGENSLELYENGSIGSFYSNIDVDTAQSIGEHISIRDIIDEFYVNDLISSETMQSIYDPSLRIGNKMSDEYDSLFIHQVSSKGTYDQFLGYHDETTLLDDNERIIESRLKIKNKIIRSIMKRNMIDIGMAGTLLLKGKITVGKKLRVLFLNSNSDGDEKNFSEQVDMTRSGDYFIVAINNKFSGDNHVAQLRLTKLGDLPENFTI